VAQSSFAVVRAHNKKYERLRTHSLPICFSTRRGSWGPAPGVFLVLYFTLIGCFCSHFDYLQFSDECHMEIGCCKMESLQRAT
jgi:hypothetical protein